MVTGSQKKFNWSWTYFGFTTLGLHTHPFLVLQIGVKVLYSVPEKHLKMTIFSEVKDYFMFELCSKIVNSGIEGIVRRDLKEVKRDIKWLVSL
jgi:hypothetical protein